MFASMSVEFAKPIEMAKLKPDFERRFPMEMGILRIGGVYPGQTEATQNPYTGEDEREYFGNIGEHCMAVALCSEIIAEGIFGKDSSKTISIVKRALVHDSTKRFEIMRRKAVKAGALDDAYSKSAYEKIKPLLEEKGVAPDIIEYMSTAGSETGHISFPDFVRVVDGEPVLNTQDNLAEMIVHLADDMTHTPIGQPEEALKTHFLTTHERMEASDFPNRYPFMFKEGFGFDKDGNYVFVKDVSEKNPQLSNVKTYAEWQVWIASEMSKYLVELMLSQESVEDPQKYIKDLVNKAVEEKSA